MIEEKLVDWNKYIVVNIKLIQNSYLLPTVFIFSFYVRPPTYYQKCRDLQRCLSSVLHKQSRYLTIIKDLTEVT